MQFIRSPGTPLCKSEQTVSEVQVCLIASTIPLKWTRNARDPRTETWETPLVIKQLELTDPTGSFAAIAVACLKLPKCLKVGWSMHAKALAALANCVDKSLVQSNVPSFNNRKELPFRRTTAKKSKLVALGKLCFQAGIWQLLVHELFQDFWKAAQRSNWFIGLNGLG